LLYRILHKVQKTPFQYFFPGSVSFGYSNLLLLFIISLIYKQKCHDFQWRKCKFIIVCSSFSPWGWCILLLQLLRQVGKCCTTHVYGLNVWWRQKYYLVFRYSNMVSIRITYTPLTIPTLIFTKLIVIYIFTYYRDCKRY